MVIKVTLRWPMRTSSHPLKPRGGLSEEMKEGIFVTCMKLVANGSYSCHVSTKSVTDFR